MTHWTIIFGLFLLQCVNCSDGDTCSICLYDGFECVNGLCVCPEGFIPDYLHTSCVRCPGLGDMCYGPCCSRHANITLQCWRGVCRNCYGPLGIWMCREPVEEMAMISGSQIVMGTALVLGVIAILTLLYLFCSVNSTPSQTDDSQSSRGSLEVYVNQRLEDAPPKYTRTAPPGSAIHPTDVFINNGFVHDNTLPPPIYTSERKRSEENITIYI